MRMLIGILLGAEKFSDREMLENFKQVDAEISCWKHKLCSVILGILNAWGTWWTASTFNTWAFSKQQFFLQDLVNSFIAQQSLSVPAKPLSIKVCPQKRCCITIPETETVYAKMRNIEMNLFTEQSYAET